MHAVNTDDTTTDTREAHSLLELLEGLPLVIAQTGAYL